jgi:hypothetical protein
MSEFKGGARELEAGSVGDFLYITAPLACPGPCQPPVEANRNAVPLAGSGWHDFLPVVCTADKQRVPGRGGTALRPTSSEQPLETFDGSNEDSRWANAAGSCCSHHKELLFTQTIPVGAESLQSS